MTPHGTLAERMRAAGAGIPTFYTPAVGTELAEGREIALRAPETQVAGSVRPAGADEGVIERQGACSRRAMSEREKGERAEPAADVRPAGDGNSATAGSSISGSASRPCARISISATSRSSFNLIMAMAARVTVVEVEEDIPPVCAIGLDDVHTAGIFVHRIVKIPPPPEGWWPQRPGSFHSENGVIGYGQIRKNRGKVRLPCWLNAANHARSHNRYVGVPHKRSDALYAPKSFTAPKFWVWSPPRRTVIAFARSAFFRPPPHFEIAASGQKAQTGFALRPLH